MKINIFGDNDTNLSVAAGNAENINCYLVPAPSRSGLALVGRMGTTLTASLSGDKCRGARQLNSVGYVVSGTKLYSVTAAGVTTELGTVAGKDPVYMTDDGTSVIIVNGTEAGYYFNTSTSVFKVIYFPYKACSIAYIDGYIALSSDGQRWFISEVNDTDSFDALDFASAEKSADDLLAVWEDHGELILFGEKTIEPWFNNANPDFSFGRNTAGIMERGVLGRWSITKDDNTLFFIGDDMIVYRMEGYNPVRISDLDIEKRFSDLVRDGYIASLKNATMFTFSEHGHKFLQINIPNVASYCHDLATQQWHTVKHYDYNTAMGNCYYQINGKHFIGGVDGNVYEMSSNVYSDAGRPLVRTRRSSFFHNEDRLIKWKSIKLLMDFGATEVVDGSQGTSPVVMLQWYDDNGRVPRGYTELSVGAAGDYLAKAIKRNCGSSRNRQLEISMSDPAPFVVVDAYANVR